MTPWTAACQASPVLHCLPGFTQTHHWASDAIQPSGPLSPSSPFAFPISGIERYPRKDKDLSYWWCPGKIWSFPGDAVSKESDCQCRRWGFSLWVGKISWRRQWQPTPVFLPGNSWIEEPGSYSPWVPKSATRLSTHTHTHTHTHPQLKYHHELKHIIIQKWWIFRNYNQLNISNINWQKIILCENKFFSLWDWLPFVQKENQSGITEMEGSRNTLFMCVGAG